ncbi:MAG TPA: HAD-IIIA family hydrolase [Verrucomicrobiota bacterium]|nr:HAD-IIIA family hydrolase [Verrucomicrobiota bacterium]
MKGAFIERDGVLNEQMLEAGAPRSPRRMDEFRVRPEAAAPLARLRAAGLVVLATTNQPGLSDGTLPRGELDFMHAVLKRRLPLDDVLVCPHAPEDGCPCRKPRPGLVREAAFRWGLRLEHSFMISDKAADAELARAAGATSILLQSPWNGTGHHDLCVEDLETAVDQVLAHTLRLTGRAPAAPRRPVRRLLPVAA